MIRWSAAVLVVLWLLLPVRSPRPSSGPSRAECLSRADSAPDAERSHSERVLEGCVAMNPTDADLMVDLARVRESSGRLADAEAMYRRASEADPDNGEIRLRLARLLLKRGDIAAARAQAEAASRVQPNRQAVLDLLEETDRQPARVLDAERTGSSSPEGSRW